MLKATYWSLISIDVHCNDIVHFDRHCIDARRILTQGMQDSTCAGCICVGAFIFQPDAVEFIKCTQPRGALLSLGLVHFMLILWMQWYMKRGTLCAKAPGIGRKCTKRPLTVTASYSTGVIFLLDLDVPCLIKEWIALLSPMIIKWYSSNRHEETT